MIECRNVPRSVFLAPGLLLAVPLALTGCRAESDSSAQMEPVGMAFSEASDEDVATFEPLPPTTGDVVIEPVGDAPRGGVPGRGGSEGGLAPREDSPASVAPEVGAAAALAEDPGEQLLEPLLESEPVEFPGGPDAPEPVSIPAGTLIPAEMVLTLSTRTHQAGDTFYATVSEEILAADGMVLVPEGSRLDGTVVEARRSTDAGEEAVLAVAFDALVIDGVEIPLEAVIEDTDLETASAASGTRSAITVATGAAAGAVLGRILGGDSRAAVQGAAVGVLGGAGVALVTRDGHAVIREGTRVVVRLEAPAALSALP